MPTRTSSASPPRATSPDSIPDAGSTAPPAPPGLLDVAQRIHQKSSSLWGPDRAVALVGESDAMAAVLRKVEKFAQFDEPILITGESGVGKELFARACYLLGERIHRPFVPVNCPQYTDNNLSVSELFGHKKGAFTGALADHKGLFETADGGVIFLDEIADLPMQTQVMLLRALAEGEFKRLGDSATYRVNVRVIAATNRPLKDLVAANSFRNDLYFRLCYFRLELPSLRSRGDDWRLLLDHWLELLKARYKVRRRFSKTALDFLAQYPWPGNIREIKSVATTGYSMAESELIELEDFESVLYERQSEASGTPAGGPGRPAPPVPEVDPFADIFLAMRTGEQTFWDAVHKPYIERDLNRAQVRALFERGLREAHGSYKVLLGLFNLPESDYQKFMDFLRHQRLKPE
ncbi:MAG: sigma-54-dependent transcriptional regulator [Verrucomicrobiales bacterium]